MAKRIYLVRHGETQSNILNLVQDETDTLSDTGRYQARLVARRISQLKFSKLYSSDYIRAEETAQLIAVECGCEYQTLPMFREVKRPSSMVGRDKHSPEYLQYLHQADENAADPGWHFEDEENFHDVMGRVRASFALFDATDDTLVVVTHGRFLMMLVMYVLSHQELHAGLWKLAAHTMNTNNTGITVFEYDETYSHWRLQTFNDIAHFAE